MAKLGSIEINNLWVWFLRSDEHLVNTGEPNLGAGVVASERGFGEDLLGLLEVLDAERLATDDHPIETIEGALGTELYVDVVNKGTENGGDEVGP